MAWYLWNAGGGESAGVRLLSWCRGATFKTEREALEFVPAHLAAQRGKGASLMVLPEGVQPDQLAAAPASQPPRGYRLYRQPQGGRFWDPVTDVVYPSLPAALAAVAGPIVGDGIAMLGQYAVRDAAENHSRSDDLVPHYVRAHSCPANA